MSGPDGMAPLSDMLSPGPLPRSKNKGSWPKRFMALVTLVALAAALWGGLRVVDMLKVKDYAASAAGVAVEVTVPRGASLKSIAAILVDAGVIASSTAFLNAASDVVVAPGVYSLETSSPASTVLVALSDPDNRQITRMVIPEGLRLEAVVSRISEATGAPVADVRSALDEVDLPDWVPEGASAEGLLFPATYEILGIEDAEDVVDMMISRMDEEVVRLDLPARAKKLGVSVYDLVKVASVVQAEVGTTDYDKAAAVIYNRLAAGMPLQMDSTVNYATGTSDIQLSKEQLDSTSPYNTYRVKGLPPTPIGAPGAQALDAAAHPEVGSWLYFITMDTATGKTRFTDSYEKFLKWKRQAARNAQ